MKTAAKMLSKAAALLIALSPVPALAADVALVVSNPKAFAGRDVGRVADGHAALVAALDANGYDVIQKTNATRADLIDALDQLEGRMPDAERVVIHYAGGYFSDGDQTYLLPDRGSVSTLTRGLTDSIPFSLLLEFAGQAPTQSVVSLGLGRQSVLPGARPVSAPGYDIPQGVMVIRGGARDVLAVLTNEMLKNGRAAGEINPRRAKVAFEGLVLPTLTLVTPEDDTPAPTEEATPVEPGDFAEETLWALARNGNNRVAYQLYLQRYPDGRYAAQARAALGLPAPGSEPSPEQLEKDLRLTRNNRRQIQSDLTVLGFDTRGVDGIFGAGSRRAIRAWQEDNTFETTGFLEPDQIARIEAQAAIRREEIRIEEERRARRERRQDDAFWRQTGASGEEEDLRTYLNRYPNGIHAKKARAIIDELDAERARIADNEAFDNAREANTERAYARYIQRFPDGAHVREARRAIDDLRRANVDLDEVERYRDQERALGLNVASALVLEQRIRSLGYPVGPVDGRFDRATREAIAMFQGDQRLPKTGYLNATTIQRLILASSR